MMGFDNSSLGWVVLTIVFLEVVMIIFLSTPESALSAREVEDRSAVALFGDERASNAKRFSNTYFTAHFLDTGFVDRTQAMFIPSEEQKARAEGLEDFVPSVFSWAQRRLDGLWAMAFGTYHRVYVMGFMVLISVPFMIPALINGLIGRRIAIEENEVATPVFFHGAKKTLVVLLVMPLFVLFLPFQVNTVIWWCWCFALPIAIYVTSKNVQEL